MEPNLVLSLGSAIAVIGLFYTWHKDSRQSAETIATLSARVTALEHRAQKTDEVLQELLVATQDIKITLARIDTKLTTLEQEFNRKHNN